MPFGARSVGRADIRPGWVHGSGTIHWTNLYWGHAGQVCFAADTKRCVLPANHIILHPPGTRIDGRPNERSGAYRWLTLDGPLVDRFLRSFGFTYFEPFHAGRCPVELFDQLERDVKDASTAGEYRASATVYEILARGAWGRRLEPSPDRARRIVDQCLRRIQDQYHQPELTVDRLARELQIHRSTLTRLFAQSVGLPVSRYIQSLRLRRALSLLKDRDKTIRQVAFACGFADPAYFSRCLSREMGAAPRQIRDRLM